MLLFFRAKQEVVTRTPDFTNEGFCALPLNKKRQEKFEENLAQENEEVEFCWSTSLIKDLFALFLSIFLSALAYGILMVMIALRLEANVKNEILISLSTVTQIGAGVVFSRFLPSLGQKNGLIKSIYLGSTVSAICALLLYHYFNYTIWLLVIYALGTSLFTCGVTRNTIMIDLAPTHVKAMIISFGTMLVALGNSFGPILISVFKTSDGFTSFALASALYFLSNLPLARLKKVDSMVREQKKISIWRYIKNSPKIMFSGFSVSYAMSSCSAFAIIYGIKMGMPESEASLLLSVLLFGTIFCIPVGYISDHLNRRMLMIGFAFLALVSFCQLYLNTDPQKIHILLFITFACLTGMKIPTIVLINERYKPTQRLAVNSAYSRVTLLGNICGLLSTGVIMNALGANGLWISSMIILVLFLIFCLSNYLKKFIKKEIQFKDFSIFNPKTNEQREY